MNLLLNLIFLVVKASLILFLLNNIMWQIKVIGLKPFPYYFLSKIKGMKFSKLKMNYWKIKLFIYVLFSVLFGVMDIALAESIIDSLWEWKITSKTQVFIGVVICGLILYMFDNVDEFIQQMEEEEMWERIEEIVRQARKKNRG